MAGGVQGGRSTLVGPVVAAAAICGATAALVWNLQAGRSGFLAAGGGNLLIAISFAAVGGFLVRRVARNAVGWILLLTGVTQALSLMVGAVATATGEPVANLALWTAAWVWAPGVWGALVLLPLLFPDGRAPTPRWRPVVRLAVICITVATAGYAVQATVHSNAVKTVVDGIVVAAEVGIGACALAGLVALAGRWRRGRGVERQQLKWLLLAVLVLLAQYAVSPILPEGVADTASVVIPILLPLALAVAVLQHGLYEIDVLLNRSLLYGSLTAAVLGVYIASVAVFGRLSGLQLGPALVATAIVAVAFDPVRRRLQTGANRLVFGRRDEPLTVVSRLSRRLEEAVSAEQLLDLVVEEISAALRVPHVAVDVRLPDELTRVAEVGKARDTEVVVPLIYQAVEIGQLVTCPRRSGETLTPADLRFLTALAPSVASTSQALRLTQDLRRSHQHIAAVRTSERQRLRADLHDGLGPLLAGIELGISGAHRMLPQEHAVVPTLERLEEQLHSAKAEVRRLLDDLRPGAVERVGLAEALCEHAALINSDQGGPAVNIDVEGLRTVTLSPAVADAAYRIVTEALTNMLRHSGARSCWVTAESGASLRLQVKDDGRGLANSTEGTGRMSMRERAKALGGSCRIEQSPAGGTIVEVELPFAPPTAFTPSVSTSLEVTAS